MTDTERERINAICEVAGVAEIDDLSDGFHTFRQLYYQRMMLFATIVKQNKDKAWKSLRHEDGELCFGGGWFIVGIDTPEGSYTYHYENKYFDLFDCEILDYGKHWDGHTEKDVTRLLSLPKTQLSKEGTTFDTISRQAALEKVRSMQTYKLFMGDDMILVDKAEVQTELMMLPPAQPEANYDEWCTGCKEYDQEHHNCPRWNKVIRQTLKDIESHEWHWIPVSERLPSKDERKEWIDNNLDGIGYLYPCLVTRYSSINPDRTKNNPYVAKHYFDGEDFLNAGEEVCSEYIIAWMPLPEAYKPNEKQSGKEGA